MSRHPFFSLLGFGLAFGPLVLLTVAWLRSAGR